MKRIGVLTSGGDAPGMNAAIRAVVRTAIAENMEIYGIERGYEGMINGEIRRMDISSVGDIIHRGGTILKTARSERFVTPEGFQRGLDMIENFGLEGLVVIGGDGSLTGGLELSRAGVPVMGLPGTIHNGLAYTDFTIGFDTSVNTVLNAIGNIRDTSSSHERTTVVEVMGRNCGDIALYAGLAGGAETVLIPEVEADIKNRGKVHSLIVRAEGVKMTSQELAKVLEERTGIETKVVVLGYVQRGGSPTARDRMLASQVGYRAVQLLKEDSSSRAIGISGNRIIDIDLEQALKMQRIADTSLIRLAEILS